MYHEHLTITPVKNPDDSGEDPVWEDFTIAEKNNNLYVSYNQRQLHSSFYLSETAKSRGISKGTPTKKQDLRVQVKEAYLRGA